MSGATTGRSTGQAVPCHNSVRVTKGMFSFGSAFQAQQRISRTFLQTAAEQDSHESASRPTCKAKSQW
jgi:hypothetical protein